MRSESGPVCLASFFASLDCLAPAVFRGSRFVPGHFQFAARGDRRVSRAGENRNARHDLGRLAVAFDNECIGHARELADLLEIRFLDLAADRRALLEHGVLHAGDDLVYAEQRLTGNDQRVVDAADALAEQLVILALLQLERLLVRHGQRGRLVRELAVAETTIAGSVHDAAVFSRALALADVPVFRRGGDQHRPRSRAGTAQLIPVRRNRARAAGELPPVERCIDLRLLDAHFGPIRVQLFRDDHREGSLDALADLRVLGIDENAAVGCDAQIGVRREALLAAVGVRERSGAIADVERQREAAAGHADELEKRAAVQRRDAAVHIVLCFRCAKHFMHVGVRGQDACFRLRS